MGSTGVPVGPTVILRYTYDVCASNWGVTAIEIGPTVTILNNVLIVLIFLTSILLTLTILMHKGQGGGFVGYVRWRHLLVGRLLRCR